MKTIIFSTEVFFPELEFDKDGQVKEKDVGVFERVYICSDKVIMLKDVGQEDGQPSFRSLLFLVGINEPLRCKDESIEIAKVMMGAD